MLDVIGPERVNTGRSATMYGLAHLSQTNTTNKRNKPVTESAVGFILESNVLGALPVLARARR